MASWETVKKGADMKLDGITFDVELRDGTMAACTLTDKSGNAVRFVLESYSVVLESIEVTREGSAGRVLKIPRIGEEKRG